MKEIKMSAVRKLSAAVGFALAAMGAPMVANAQVSDGVVKIGVLSDMSSLYADIGGPRAVARARMGGGGVGGAEPGHERQGQGVPRVGRCDLRPHRQGLLAQHGALDL